MSEERLCLCRHDGVVVSLVKSDADLEDDEAIDIEFVGMPKFAGKKFRNFGDVWEFSKEDAITAMLENDEMIARCLESNRIILKTLDKQRK